MLRLTQMQTSIKCKYVFITGLCGLLLHHHTNALYTYVCTYVGAIYGEHVRFAADTILHINIVVVVVLHLPHISYNFQQNIVTSAVHKVQIVYGITLSHFSHKYKAKQSAAVLVLAAHSLSL